MHKKYKCLALLTLLFCSVSFTTAWAAATSSARIKDLAKVQGVRANQLTGYGLVVGLSGTGDSNKTVETLQSIANMLKVYGVNISAASLKSKNVAAVMVTATLPAFAKAGDTMDITVSSMGDAKSIQGGTLLQTPLKAANGQVYAVGQGAVSTGGFIAGNGGSTRQKNFPTVGTTPNGAIVEKSVEDTIGDNGSISLSLSQADFTTSSRIAEAINARYGSIASAVSPGRVDVLIPGYYRGNVVGFVSDVENLYVQPDNTAKVVVNERTGTIVIGGNVSVDEIAIAQGGLSISIQKTEDVNQPAPFTMGETITTKNTDTQVKEEKANTIVLPSTANVGDIVGALNAVGATPRDIISILQAIKAAGALHADLEII